MSNVPVAFVAVVCGEPWIFSSPIHFPVSFSSFLCCSVGFGCSIRSSDQPHRDDELDMSPRRTGHATMKDEVMTFEESGRVASDGIRGGGDEDGGRVASESRAGDTS